MGCSAAAFHQSGGVTGELPAEAVKRGLVYRLQTAALYQQYRALAETEAHTSFIGRLATYRYYNMDQVVGMALAEFDRVRKTFEPS